MTGAENELNPRTKYINAMEISSYHDNFNNTTERTVVH